MSLTVLCYLWGQRKYRDFGAEHVNVLARMVERHLPREHRFVCITDEHPHDFDESVHHCMMPTEARQFLHIMSPEGIQYPSCYVRLWTFSEAAKMLGDRVLLLDIDMVIKGDISRLVDHDEDFVGWRPNTVWGNADRFAGGGYLLRTGTRTEVWADFISDPFAAQTRAHKAGFRGSDQAWISYCLGSKEKCFDSDLMAPPEEFPSYNRAPKQKVPYSGWKALDKNSQWLEPPTHPVIQFCGHTKPWQLLDVPWIKEHWR